MELRLTTPLGALFALAGLLPLAVLLLCERRARPVREALWLFSPRFARCFPSGSPSRLSWDSSRSPRRSRSSRRSVRQERTDAEAFVLVDVSRDGRPPPCVLAPAGHRAYFFHLWDAEEEIYETGVPERGYEPDRESARALANVAGQTGGRVFAETETDELGVAAEAFFGTGATRERVTRATAALMPHVTLAALLPLGFVLVRRNL